MKLAGKIIIIGIMSMALCFSNQAWAASADRLVKKADKLSGEEKYAEALKEYDEALTLKPDDPVIQYNRAVTLYRKGDFTEAEDAFLRSLAAGEEDLEEKTVYNTGNSKYRTGGRGESTICFEELRRGCTIL